MLNVRGGYHQTERPHSIIIGSGLPIRLAGPGRLNLRLVHHYKILENPDQRRTWSILTVGYFYALDDSDDREIIVSLALGRKKSNSIPAFAHWSGSRL